MKEQEWLDNYWQNEIEQILKIRTKELWESLVFLTRVISTIDKIDIMEARETALITSFRDYIKKYSKELDRVKVDGYRTLSMPINKGEDGNG